MTSYSVGYFVGSLSSTSINRTLSRALIGLAPDDLEFSEIRIDNLPLYSPDYDASYPPEAVALKDAIAESDAILKCADNCPSLVTAVQRSPSTRTAGLPMFTMGSIASTIPSASRGPRPGTP